ncbi:hypothetical protein SCHPADRAFT_203793 [Schizopora paradoxa]|uniref:Uncharacterized protein n=1 Tax=Schizopora paradoxa TaxID=27342 RepID=A0A0H2RY47_9AGAM|nr:hypothetical protein SCHPADRAFT_203793 [Schizopora paradoxa]
MKHRKESDYHIVNKVTPRRTFDDRGSSLTSLSLQMRYTYMCTEIQVYVSKVDDRRQSKETRRGRSHRAQVTGTNTPGKKHHPKISTQEWPGGLIERPSARKLTDNTRMSTLIMIETLWKFSRNLKGICFVAPCRGWLQPGISLRARVVYSPPAK